MTSVSHASRTTNNIAEYRGLLVRLRHAARSHLQGIHVVGDSNLIITQLRTRRLPRAKHLQSVYAQCITLVDQLIVPIWTHHLRQFNKMADSLVNIAMDFRTSKQVPVTDMHRLPTRWNAVTDHPSNGTWATR